MYTFVHIKLSYFKLMLTIVTLLLHCGFFSLRGDYQKQGLGGGRGRIGLQERKEGDFLLTFLSFLRSPLVNCVRQKGGGGGR